MNAKPTLLLVLSLAAAVPAQTRWQALSPAASPPNRAGHGFVFAGPHGGVVFGGQDGSTYLNDTWQWNGAAWTQVTTASSPSRRAHFCMCYDPARDRVVLFSGWDGNRYPADTWEFDGTAWTQATPAASPPGRDWAAMEYDPISNRVILFGGHDWQRSTAGLPNYADTWAWDGTAWTQLQPANAPSPRWGHRMVYHAARGTVLLHGGTGGTDTWEWTGADWSSIPTNNAPPARTRPGIAYDALRARTVLFSGVVAGAIASDVWEFDGADWSQRMQSGAPPVADTIGIFDPMLMEVVNFGGGLAPNRSTTSNATDSYGPVTPATSSVFGSGCTGSAGAPSMDVSRLAWAGAAYDIGVSSAPAGAAVFFLVGLSNTRTSAGLPLPFSLGGIGMSGCTLLVDPIATAQTLADPGGFARLQLGVPGNASLVGAHLYAQAMVVSPGANGLGLVVSNGADHRIGGL